MSNEYQLAVPKKKKQILIIMFGIILVLVISVTAFGYHYHTVQVEEQAKIHAAKLKEEKKKKAELQYLKNVNNVLLDIKFASVKAKDIINRYQQVWHDAIYDNTYTSSDGQIQIVFDFNQAIRYQRDEYEKAGTITELNKEMSTINNLMNKLKEPSSKYKKVYNETVDLYSTLTNYIKMAEDPSGSLVSYTNQATNMDNDISKKINNISVQLPN